MIPNKTIMDTLEKKLMSVIKQRARDFGLTQTDLARDLNVSLITIKRWYSGKGLRITNLESLCERLGINISEIFTLANSSEPKTFYYSIAQEEALATEPKLLALFDLLIGGVTLNQIKKKYKIEDKKLTSLLLKLDKLKLIELYANNKVKLLSTGEPTWNPTGPLTRRFRLQMINEFLKDHEKSSTTFFIHDYLIADSQQISKKLKDLETFMLESNKRASFYPNEAKSFGVYLTIREYEWNLRASLE